MDMSHTTTMEQMLESQLAIQKEMKTNQERLEAKMGSHQEEIKARWKPVTKK
jgi:hypothetical protein